MPVTTGEKLRQLRVTRKVSQQRLANAIFVKNTTISNWEKGTRQIDIQSLKAISDFFGVSLDYFSDKQNPTKPTEIKTSFRLVMTISAIVAFIVSGVSLLLNQAQNLDNLACYGESDCYLIDDPMLITEMNSRNLSGGSMTNIEMDRVMTFLSLYQKPVPPTRKATELYAAYWAKANKEIDYLVNNEFSLNHYGVYEHLVNYEPDLWWDTFINLGSINQNYQQVVTTEAFNEAKLVIYKRAAETFVYEVWTNQIDIFTIDLTQGRLYLNQNLVDLSSWISESIYLDFYHSIHSDDTWVDINGDQWGWLSLEDGWYLSYNVDFVLYQGHSELSKYHRFRLINIESDEFYYMEVFKTNQEGVAKRFINIYYFISQNQEGERSVVLETELVLNEIFFLSALRDKLVDDTILIPFLYSVYDENGMLRFLNVLEALDALPNIAIDLSDAIVPERFSSIF
jgi:transcriptional regulator with XRE-family HTH domain